jgi:hypothetical protein
MFLLISVVRAAPPEPGYVPLAPLPNTTRPGPGGTEVVDFTSYVPAVFNLSIGLAGVLAVIMMIIGGIQYLSTDSISGKNEGRKQIGAALGGLLLALGAFLILQTINPKLVNFDLDITGVGVEKNDNNNGRVSTDQWARCPIDGHAYPRNDCTRMCTDGNSNFECEPVTQWAKCDLDGNVYPASECQSWCTDGNSNFMCITVNVVYCYNPNENTCIQVVNPLSAAGCSETIDECETQIR